MDEPEFKKKKMFGTRNATCFLNINICRIKISVKRETQIYIVDSFTAWSSTDVYSCYTRSWKMEVGRSDMQGHPQLHSNFRANLGYLKDPDVKKQSFLSSLFYTHRLRVILWSIFSVSGFRCWSLTWKQVWNFPVVLPCWHSESFNLWNI